jgi:hypothetical protein
MNQMTLTYEPVIEEICNFDWAALTTTELTAVAWAYYYFSVQFRENLEVMHREHPTDPMVQMLVREECATPNLSPFPGVAAPNEAMNHDDFMFRLLKLSPIDPTVQMAIESTGEMYLSQMRAMPDEIKVMSIASYECGGLESVFKSILWAQQWSTPLLAAFKHFLVKHIDFDSDPEAGHGALIKHIAPDQRIRPVWEAFRDLLVMAVPRFRNQ